MDVRVGNFVRIHDDYVDKDTLKEPGFQEWAGSICTVEKIPLAGSFHVRHLELNMIGSFSSTQFDVIPGHICAECDGPASEDDYLCRSCRRNGS